MRYDDAIGKAQAKATPTTTRRKVYKVTDPVAVGGSKMPTTTGQELTEQVATNLRHHGSTVEEIAAAAITAPTDSTVIPAVQQYRDAVAAFRAADARCLATLHAGETDAYTIASRERKAARDLRTRLESSLPQDCRAEEIAAADYMQKIRASEDNNLTNRGDKATMTTANTTTTTTKTNKTAAKKAAAAAPAVTSELTVELDQPSASKTATGKKSKAAESKATSAPAASKTAPVAAPKSAEPAKGAAKGASKTAAKTEAVKTEAVAKPEAGGDRAAKLRENVLAVFKRINAATVEQPLQRSELSSIERRIARGLAHIGVATRLEENGRNIRYHRAGDMKEMPKWEATINEALTDTPKVFV